MLADCHIHMVLDGKDWKAALYRHEKVPDIPWIRQQLAAYQKAGVGYLRDGGDRWGVGKAARALAPEYGIIYRTPLAPLCKAGHYGSFIGITYDSMASYTKLVEKTKRDGGDFIKIMISGLMDFDRPGVLTELPLPEKEIWELIHIAHSEGMAVMAHANGLSALWAAQAGVDSVEHGAYLEEEALYAMKENGTVWVPTLSTIGNLWGKGRFSESAVQRILESALERVKKFAAIGGVLAPGTDAGAWAVPHGSRTEEALLSLAGVTEKVIRRGTAAIQEKF